MKSLGRSGLTVSRMCFGTLTMSPLQTNMRPEDGARLRKHLEYEFDRGNRQIYWDDVAMFCHFEDYRLGIREMNSSDIIEIDGLDELVAIDHSYQLYLQKQEKAED